MRIISIAHNNMPGKMQKPYRPYRFGSYHIEYQRFNAGHVYPKPALKHREPVCYTENGTAGTVFPEVTKSGFLHKLS